MNNEKGIKYGAWDAIHVVTCNMKAMPKVEYRVISTVMITLDAEGPELGSMNIAGSCSKTRDEAHNVP